MKQAEGGRQTGIDRLEQADSGMPACKAGRKNTEDYDRLDTRPG